MVKASKHSLSVYYSMLTGGVCQIDADFKLM